MARATLDAVHPVLMSRDVEASIAFYVARLGFTLVGRDAPTRPDYAVVARDGVVLHLQRNDPADWGAGDRPMYRFAVRAVENLFDEFKDRGVFHADTALRDTPWGTREFAFYDPDRNGLVFYRDRERG